MKIFDMHTHCFPDSLAPRALPHLAEVAQSSYNGDGTYGSLCSNELEGGCCGAMMLHIATKPSQMDSVNRFAIECQNGNFYSFGSVFPIADNAVEMLHHIKKLGLKGVKLHPEYQGFFVDDPAVFPIYQAAAELKLPITFHAGYDPYSPSITHCTPKALASVADRFPELTIIAAHMGGMRMPDEVEKHIVGKANVYFDTAYASFFLNASELKRLIRLHGADKIFFATDFPWSTVEAELSLLKSCDLTDKELSMICFENAQRVFNLELN